MLEALSRIVTNAGGACCAIPDLAQDPPGELPLFRIVSVRGGAFPAGLGRIAGAALMIAGAYPIAAF